LNLDSSGQIDVAVRLLVAAVLGAVIGIEREIHDHPAGMRTHLLVSLGAAIFTVLSIYGFAAPPGGAPPDPTRIAAQVVSGIGFLGAGAILKFGTSVKGLTTAASLWATAAIGMGAAAGAWVAAILGTAIILASLWPLHWLVGRLRHVDGKAMRLELGLHDLADLGPVIRELHRRRIDIIGMDTEKVGKARYEVHLTLGLPQGAVRGDLIEAVGGMQGVSLTSAESGGNGAAT
jgi:putative Mg2+ transporter-C (MgtC) family protein